MWQLSLVESDRATPRATLAPQTYASPVALGRDSFVDAVGRLSALVSRVHLSIRATGHDATLTCAHKGTRRGDRSRPSDGDNKSCTTSHTTLLGGQAD